MTNASATNPRNSSARTTAIAIDSTVSRHPPSAGFACCSAALACWSAAGFFSSLVLDMLFVGQTFPSANSFIGFNGRQECLPHGRISPPPAIYRNRQSPGTLKPRPLTPDSCSLTPDVSGFPCRNFNPALDLHAIQRPRHNPPSQKRLEPCHSPILPSSAA